MLRCYTIGEPRRRGNRVERGFVRIGDTAEKRLLLGSTSREYGIEHTATKSSTLSSRLSTGRGRVRYVCWSRRVHRPPAWPAFDLFGLTRRADHVHSAVSTLSLTAWRRGKQRKLKWRRCFQRRCSAPQAATRRFSGLLHLRQAPKRPQRVGPSERACSCPSAGPWRARRTAPMARW